MQASKFGNLSYFLSLFAFIAVDMTMGCQPTATVPVQTQPIPQPYYAQPNPQPYYAPVVAPTLAPIMPTPAPLPATTVLGGRYFPNHIFDERYRRSIQMNNLSKNWYKLSKVKIQVKVAMDYELSTDQMMTQVTTLKTNLIKMTTENLEHKHAIMACNLVSHINILAQPENLELLENKNDKFLAEILLSFDIFSEKFENVQHRKDAFGKLLIKNEHKVCEDIEKLLQSADEHFESVISATVECTADAKVAELTDF